MFVTKSGPSFSTIRWRNASYGNNQLIPIVVKKRNWMQHVQEHIVMQSYTRKGTHTHAQSHTIMRNHRHVYNISSCTCKCICMHTVHGSCGHRVWSLYPAPVIITVSGLFKATWHSSAVRLGTKAFIGPCFRPPMTRARHFSIALHFDLSEIGQYNSNCCTLTWTMIAHHFWGCCIFR